MTKTTIIAYGLLFALLCVFLILGKRKQVWKRCPLCLKYRDQDGRISNGLDLPERDRCFPEWENCENCENKEWEERL